MRSRRRRGTFIIGAVLATVLAFGGIVPSADAIEGGAKARLKDWPSIVSVGTTCDSHDSATGYQCDRKPDQSVYGIHDCGGSLIAATWVLTAEHCTIGNDNMLDRPENFRVTVGRVDLQKAGGRHVLVKRIIRYARADTYASTDVALLELSTPLPGPYQTLARPDEDNLVAGRQKVYAAGWGPTQDPGNDLPVASPILNAAALTTVDARRCADDYAAAQFGDYKVRGIVCTNSKHGVGTEPFDSGGPLLSPFRDGRRQVGIVSSGGGADVPDLYMRVSTFRSWIYKRVPEIGPCATVVHASC